MSKSNEEVYFKNSYSLLGLSLKYLHLSTVHPMFVQLKETRPKKVFVVNLTARSVKNRTERKETVL